MGPGVTAATTPRVGVLIVNWNSGPLLARCLDALAAQTRVPDRVLVIDNASADGSERAAQDRRGVELLRMESNLGFAEANNVGVRHLDDCAWIALLNPDAFAEPRWLEALVSAAARDADADVASFASCQRLADTPSILDGTGDEYTVAGLAWRRDHGRAAEGNARVAGEIFGPCAAAGLYRRAAFLEVGGFDASYFCYFEDVDLAFRLRLRGYRSRYVPEAVVHHVGSALSGYRSDFAVFHGHRNLVWTFFKDMPTPLLALYLPHHLAMNLAAVLVAARRGQGLVALKAKAAAIIGLPRVLRARRAAQGSRTAGALEVRAAMVQGLRAFGLGRKR